MKRIILLIFITITTLVNAQNTDDSLIKNARHEVKINTFNLVLFSAADFSYEYNINTESSTGLSTFIHIESDNNETFNWQKKFSLTPFYRRYFSDNYAEGFFIEGFGMLNVFDKIDYGDFIQNQTVERETNFALGFSVGTKFISKKGFVAETYFGLGRNFLNTKNEDNSNVSSDTNLVGRSGISLGFRF